MDRWRLISDPPLTGAENMATDEAILRRAPVEGLPALRLYSWTGPTISIGFRQDSAPYEKSGLPVVRRITGGRAVLHDAEITYSVAAGSDNPLFSGGITAAYAIISRCVAAALKDAGVPAEFAPHASRGAQRSGRDHGACFHTPSRYEVLAGGKKLVGSAQRRFKDVFLQHGSILLGIDERMSSRVFCPDLLARMTSVAEYTRITPEVLKGFLVKRLSEGLSVDFTQGGLTPEEERLKGILIGQKYARDEWNRGAGRPGEFLGPSGRADLKRCG
jgi:lipoate-protein ligase A